MYGFFRLFKVEVHVAIGKIRRQQVKQLIIGTANKIIQVALALNQALASALYLWFDAVVITGSAVFSWHQYTVSNGRFPC